MFYIFTKKDMITDFASLDLNKTFTYADYLTWQFQERLELIKGRIFEMSPAPLRWHQEISGRIFGEFQFFLKRKSCKVFNAPFDVRLPKSKNEKADNQVYTVVQPDIVVVCDKDKLDRRGCIGAPDIVVEILSPATASKDVKEKFQIYEESGVKEYWIVYPGEALVEIFLLDKEGKYVQDKLYTRDDDVKTSLLKDFSLNLNEVFEGIEDEGY